MLSAREDAGIIRDLKNLADAKGTDVSALIRQAVREFLAREAKA